MTEDREIDVEELQAELDQIKDAMGIQERYEGATSGWLLFGVTVPVAAALSQYVVLARLPQWYHSLIWFGVLGGGFAVYAVLRDVDVRPSTSAGKPTVWAQFALAYGAAFPLQAIASAYAGDLGYVAGTALAFAIIFVMIGVAYGVIGTSLKAYYVRRRDRVVFYVGAAWMILLGTLIPAVPALETWAAATFGGLYVVYAMAAYLVLTRTRDTE